MAGRKTKFVGPLYLAGDEYDWLERAGLAEERDPLQHARWLIKLALQEAPAAAPASPTGTPVGDRPQATDPAAGAARH